jgi:hypothetical protein
VARHRTLEEPRAVDNHGMDAKRYMVMYFEDPKRLNAGLIGRKQLLKAGAQLRGVADRRVVRAEVVANLADSPPGCARVLQNLPRPAPRQSVHIRERMFKRS